MARKKAFIATRSGMHIGQFSTRAEAEQAIKDDQERTFELARKGWCSYPPSFWWDVVER